MKENWSLHIIKYHAMKTYGRVEVKLHVPAALPPEKKSPVCIRQEAEWGPQIPSGHDGEEQSPWSCQNSNTGRPV